MPNLPYTWFNLNDGASGELNAVISAAATSAALGAGQGDKFPTSDFVVKCGTERIHVATRSTDTLNGLTRGYDNSTAAIHLIGEVVYQTADRSLFQRIYDQITGHTHNKADIPDFAHNHAQGDITNLVTDLAGKAATGHNHDAAYSAIDHTHAGGSDPFIFKAALAADASTGANVTPISLSGLVFTYEANSRYMIDFCGATRAAAATTGSGFQFDCSTAVTRVGASFNHQLANTGTTSGGSSIADDASVGVSSGRPSANVDTPVFGTGYLVTGANTGTCQLRYRSEVAAVSTVMAGFMMRVHKVV